MNMSVSEAAMDRLMGAWNRPVPFPDAKPALQKLKGFSRVILSNGDEAMLSEGVAHSGLSPWLEDVLSVEPARHYKPHPQAYRQVLARYGVPRGEVWFVSSNGWDAAGASSFGFRSIWVNRRSQVRERLVAEPRKEVSNLVEAAEVIRAGV
ncbi:haloacid dehalogenase type II [Sulfobacillus sp. DSM 109850]|uniref:Haloacid dehalogenase type II n=1 Tax=Sulfobacillus harzensis TaxID=2729629 RepID=A0A7Y0L4L4_9FIRM|nr:haloacid dehalogenase type II [Sulfobacillus harzensis]